MRVAVKREDTIAGGVIDNCVRVLGCRNMTQDFQRPRVKTVDRAVLARCRIAAPRLVDECDAMRAVDARDLAEQLPSALVDDHHTILARDEQAVVRGIRDDVVPASLATKLVGVAHRILCGCRLGETDRDDDERATHESSCWMDELDGHAWISLEVQIPRFARDDIGRGDSGRKAAELDLADALMPRGVTRPGEI